MQMSIHWGAFSLIISSPYYLSGEGPSSQHVFLTLNRPDERIWPKSEFQSPSIADLLLIQEISSTKSIYSSYKHWFHCSTYSGISSQYPQSYREITSLINELCHQGLMSGYPVLKLLLWSHQCNLLFICTSVLQDSVFSIFVHFGLTIIRPIRLGCHECQFQEQPKRNSPDGLSTV